MSAADVKLDLTEVGKKMTELELALSEIEGFARRNFERAKQAFLFERENYADDDAAAPSDLKVAEARYHEAQRIYLVIKDRVERALNG